MALSKIGSQTGIEATRIREGELHPDYKAAWDNRAATLKTLVANSNASVDEFAAIRAQLEALLHRPF